MGIHKFTAVRTMQSPLVLQYESGCQIQVNMLPRSSEQGESDSRFGR